ncbi:MAG: hypothetical protein ACI81T_002198 [Bacteroidia bacterium]|jgi:hypothetical protein
MNTIKKINDYLLTNYRLIWETKIVYLLLYLIPSYLLIVSICTIYPIRLQYYRAESEDVATALAFCIAIVNLLIFLVWMYKNSQYRIERDFGFNFKFIEQSRFGIYFIGISLLVIQPFIPVYIIEQKVDGLVSDYELKQDIVALNQGNIYFPSKSESEQDNIFYSKNKVFENEKNSDSYLYNDSYFGGSSSVAEDAIETGGILAEEKTKKENSEAYFKKRITDALNDDKALSKIQNYLTVVNKYAYSKRLQNLNSEEVFNAFKSEYTSIGTQLDKELIRTNLENIQKSKARIARSNNIYVFLCLLLGAFCLTISVQISKHIGLKNFLLAIVFNIGVYMFFKFISELIGFGGIGGMFASLFVFGFLLFQTLKIPRLKTKQNLKVISLSTLQVYSPFFLYGILLSIAYFASSSITDKLWIEYDSYEIMSLATGCLIYLTFLLPLFRKLHLRLHALPNE